MFTNHKLRRKKDHDCHFDNILYSQVRKIFDLIRKKYISRSFDNLKAQNN